MNLDCLSLNLFQLKTLCQSNNNKSQQRQEEEIRSVCNQIGSEATTHLTRVLLQFSEKSESKPLHPAVLSELSSLLCSGSGRAAFCTAADQRATTELLPLVTEGLGLSNFQSLALALSLQKAQCNPVREAATTFINQKLPKVVEEACDSSLKDSPQVLHGILLYIRTNPSVVSPQLKDRFYEHIDRSFQSVPLLLRPFLPRKRVGDFCKPCNVKMDAFGSLPDLLREVGYVATNSVVDCHKILAKAGQINAPTIARTLFNMGRMINNLETDPNLAATMLEREFTAADMPKTWNPQVLAEALTLKEPTLNWYDVVQSLDFPGFKVNDAAALRVIVNCVKYGLYLKDKSTPLETVQFPVDRLLLRWNNREGQFSVFKMALHNPEIIPFGEFECQQVHINVLKTPPDESDRQVASWRSINLMEALLHLGDDPSLREGVKDLISIGIVHCPDVIILSLAQAQTQWTSLRKELLDKLIVRYLNPNTNSSSVIVYIWNNCGQMPQLRELLKSALKNYYKENSNDQQRLVRIYDIAKEIKALQNLLKISSEEDFKFAIDLACLASRQNFLNLKKWLEEYQTNIPFIHELRKLAQNMQISGADIPKEVLTIHEFLESTLQKQAPISLPNLSNIGNMSIGNMSNSGPPPGVDHTSQLRTGMMSPSSIPMATDEQFRALTNLTHSPIMKSGFGKPGITPSPPTFQPSIIGGPLGSNAFNNTSSGMSGNFEGLGGISPGVFQSPNYSDFQTNAVKDLFQRSALGSSSGISPTSSSLPGSIGGVPVTGIPGLSLDPKVSGFNMPSFNPLGRPNLAGLSGIGNIRNNPFGNPGGIVQPPDTHRLAGQQIGGQQDHESDLIRKRIDSLFKELFENTITEDHFVSLVKQMKMDSGQQKDFKLLIRMLITEFRNYSTFPTIHVERIAKVWGKILSEEILDGPDQTLVQFLRQFLSCVCEALKNGIKGDDKLLLFGETALQRFILGKTNGAQMLKKKPIYASFCDRVVEVVFSRGGEKRIQPPKMIQMIKDCAALARQNQDQPPPDRQRPDVIDPPENVTDKIKFIINNLSKANLKQKAKEVRECLEENVQYYIWLSAYLISQRVLKEENFLQTYADVVEELSIKSSVRPPFNVMIREELVSAIKGLLQKNKQSGDMESRKILKNFGTFLGLLTIARNKAILADEIDFKFLLLEAHLKKYSENSHVELKFVVPFVAKVLEVTKKSLVFQLRVEQTTDPHGNSKGIATGNAWTRGVMMTLIELYKEPHASEVLKFEVEILCKEHLKLQVEHFETNAAESFLTNEHARINIQSPRYKSQLSPPKETSPVPQSHPLTPEIQQSARYTTPNPVVPLNTPQPQTPNQPQFHYDHLEVIDSVLAVDLYPVFERFLKVRENLPIVQILGNVVNVKREITNSIAYCFHDKLMDSIERIIERSSKIATTATENLIKKDFALESDDQLTQMSAHNLARYLASGMAMNHLAGADLAFSETFEKKLTELFMTHPKIMGDVKQAELCQTNAKILTSDNIELFICYIQKRTAERAISQITQRLLPELTIRRRARTDSTIEQRFLHQQKNLINYHLHFMPEQIRLQPGGLKHEQLQVYEEFASNIPGFIPAAPTSTIDRYRNQQVQQVQQQVVPPTTHWLTTKLVQVYTDYYSEFREHHSNCAQRSPELTRMLQTLIEGLQQAATSRDVESTTKFIKTLVISFFQAYRTIQEVQGEERTRCEQLAKTFANCLHGLRQRFDEQIQRNWFAQRVLLALHVGIKGEAVLDPRWMDPRFTEEIKLLILYGLIMAPDYDKWLQNSILCAVKLHTLSAKDPSVAHQLFGLLNMHPLQYLDQIIQFVTVLLSSLFESPSGKSDEAERWVQEFSDSLGLILSNFSANLPEETRARINDFKVRYHDLVKVFDKGNGNTAQQMMQNGMNEAKRPVSPEFKERVSHLLNDWVRIYCARDSGRDSTRGFSAYVATLNENGILKTDDYIKRFIRICTEICVDVQAVSPDEVKIRYNIYSQIDAFVRLVCLLIKHSGDAQNPGTKVNLLNQVLGIVIGVCLEHQQKSADFDQMPFQRIFIMLFYELCAPEAILESINWHTLQAFTNAYHYLRPIKAPGFVYAWIELIGYRTFVMRMMQHTPEQKGWPMYAQLLSDLLKFMAPYLRDPARMTPAFQKLYEGMLRLLLVLFHDYPQFLLSYHYAFCDMIPPNCIQLRNLVLSAYPSKGIGADIIPRNIILEDNIHEKLKKIPDMYQKPSILTKFENSIRPEEFMLKLEDYLKNRCTNESSTTFLTVELVGYLQANQDQRNHGQKWNTNVINAVVVYVGSQAIKQILGQTAAPSPETVAHNACMDIYQSLAVGLDSEGRYQFLNAIANQLRFPNIHTWYFMEVILYLFAESGPNVKEQIARVLLERVLPPGPHPWGMIVTFLMMLKREDFWTSDFVNSHQNIRKLIENFYDNFLQDRRAQPPPKLTENKITLP